MNKRRKEEEETGIDDVKTGRKERRERKGARKRKSRGDW